MKNIWKRGHLAVNKMTRNIVWNEVRVTLVPNFADIAILGHVLNMQNGSVIKQTINALSD